MKEGIKGRGQMNLFILGGVEKMAIRLNIKSFFKLSSLVIAAVTLVLSTFVSTILAAPGDHWRQVPAGGMTHIVSNGTLFVTVGREGTIKTSPDGTTWTARASGTNADLSSVTWGSKRFVAVGGTGTILTSPDGVTWSSQTSGTNQDIIGITWANNLFVAVGSNGTIRTSPDGVAWTSRTSGTSEPLTSITWGNNRFVATGATGTILASPDGMTWTSRISGTTQNLMGAIWGNNQFVAVGDIGTILSSPDGETWIARASGTSFHLYDVVWGNNRFVAVGKNGQVVTSPDGMTWTSRGTWSENLHGIAWGNNRFVAVGGQYNDIILVSSDGVTWSPLPSDRNFAGVTWGNHQFVIVGANGKILTSPDGGIWTSRTSGTSSHLDDVVWGNDRFVAVGLGTSMTSPDGMTWTSQASALFTDVAWGNNRFVAVGRNGTIQTSPDGETWTSRTSITTENLTGVTWGNNRFVAVGHNGTIRTSFNGATWTSNISGTTTKNLYGVTWGNNQFVAVGESGTILSSPDGLTWTSRSIWAPVSLSEVSWGNNRFVAVGQGSSFTSPDGAEWTPITAFGKLTSVTWRNNQFVAVGENGIIMTTIPDAPTNVSATAGNGQATVSFTLPTNDGGNPITGYTVYVENESSLIKTVTGTSSPIVVSELTNGKSYSFTLTASSASGTSVASSRSNRVTPTQPVTSVALNTGSLNMKIGDPDTTLTATVSPSDATNQNVIWSSSDTNVVTVDGTGKLHVVGIGTATVTVTTLDGGKTASAIVTVTLPQSTAPSLSSISVTNNVYTNQDIVQVSGRESGEMIRVYDAAVSGTILGTATVASGQTTVTVPVYPLSANGGIVYVSVTSPGKTESSRTPVSYSAEPVDTTAPVTTYKFSPVMSADGKYIAALSTTLSATDTGSGVLRIEYRINKTGVWTTYNGPFIVQAATTQYLEWRSIDRAGNQEITWLMDFNRGRLTQQ